MVDEDGHRRRALDVGTARSSCSGPFDVGAVVLQRRARRRCSFAGRTPSRWPRTVVALEGDDRTPPDRADRRARRRRASRSSPGVDGNGIDPAEVADAAARRGRGGGGRRRRRDPARGRPRSDPAARQRRGRGRGGRRRRGARRPSRSRSTPSGGTARSPPSSCAPGSALASQPRRHRRRRPRRRRRRATACGAPSPTSRAHPVERPLHPRGRRAGHPCPTSPAPAAAATTPPPRSWPRSQDGTARRRARRSSRARRRFTAAEAEA